MLWSPFARAPRRAAPVSARAVVLAVDLAVALAVALALVSAPAIGQPAPPAVQASPASARWIADFDSLLVHARRSYANYAWSVAREGPALAARVADTRARLATVSGDGDGRRIIERFLDGFHDPHVSLGDPVPATGTASATQTAERREPTIRDPRGTAASSACASLRYRRRDADFHRAVRATPGYRTVASTDFRAGVATVPQSQGDAMVVGFLRLPHTSQHAWPAACERAWPDVATRYANGCDDRCELTLWYASADTLLASMRVTLRALQEQGATTVVLDLTGNGGGSEWAEAIATTLAPHAIDPNPVGMVRHPHWSARFTQHVARLDSALASATGEDARRVLMRARAQADSLRRELERPCPADAPTPSCNPLVVEPPIALDAAEARRLGLDELLGVRTGYHPTPSWTGKLVVLVDERTASAAELIAAVLADRAGAAIAGARTMGAGCGFTNGGIAYALPNSRHAVRLPDCARLRSSGDNERAGIGATLGAPWERGDNDGTRTAKFQAALRELR